MNKYENIHVSHMYIIIMIHEAISFILTMVI